MPQATEELRALMNEWFGDPISDKGPSDFLLSRGFIEESGLWTPPSPSYNVSRDEFACLRFLADEWDYSYTLESFHPEAKFQRRGTSPL